MRTVISSDRLSDPDTNLTNGRGLAERIGETNTKPNKRKEQSEKGASLCFELEIA